MIKPPFLLHLCLDVFSPEPGVNSSPVRVHHTKHFVRGLIDCTFLLRFFDGCYGWQLDVFKEFNLFLSCMPPLDARGSSTLFVFLFWHLNAQLRNKWAMLSCEHFKWDRFGV